MTQIHPKFDPIDLRKNLTFSLASISMSSSVNTPSNWGVGCEGSRQATRRRVPANEHACRCQGASTDTLRSSLELGRSDEVSTRNSPKGRRVHQFFESRGWLIDKSVASTKLIWILNFQGILFSCCEPHHSLLPTW